MPKKNIYLMQVNKGPHIPFATGLIWAYANKHQEIQDNYNLKEILFLRDPIMEVVDRMEEPHILGVSNYMWNQAYNNNFSRKVKEKWPNCFIVYGGPNVPEWESDFLKENDFVDLIVRNEGEVTFYNVLKELLKDKPNWYGFKGTTIPSIKNRDYIKNPDRERIQDLDVIPSPYEMGYFDDCDKIVKERFGPNVGMDGTMQTNRGCMYKCSFCDIGANYYNKVKLFSEERVFKDLEWMSKHNCLFVNNCDSNFGIFPRDVKFAKEIVRLKEENGFPEKIRTDWAKSAAKKVHDVVEVLEKGNVNRGLTIAIQSTDETVLNAIKRSNISQEAYHELNERYKSDGICTYTELILPLPDETFDSFLDGMSGLIENGQHNCINVYDCSILPNTDFGDKEYREKYGFETIIIPQIQYHLKYEEPTYDDPAELHENIIATNTMPWEDWLKTKLWVYVVIACHFYGLTHILARFLCKYSNISIREFYEKFSWWCWHRDDGFSKAMKITYDMLKDIRSGNIALSREILNQEDLEGISWVLDEAMFIEGYIDRNNFFDNLRIFIAEELQTDINDDLLNEVLLFNTLYVVDHTKQYPIQQQFKYNLEEFIFETSYNTLEKSENTVVFDSIDYKNDLRKYCRERAWYARQIGGGRATIGREGIKKSPIFQSEANESLDKARHKRNTCLDGQKLTIDHANITKK